MFTANCVLCGTSWTHNSKFEDKCVLTWSTYYQNEFSLWNDTFLRSYPLISLCVPQWYCDCIPQKWGDLSCWFFLILTLYVREGDHKNIVHVISVNGSIKLKEMCCLSCRLLNVLTENVKRWPYRKIPIVLSDQTSGKWRLP